MVDDATPMIVNGMTTEALKLIFHERRQTIIPPGRPVPAVAQYWNRDPRPRLTLYRGSSASEDTDHFLGHFEVLDLPASDNLNVFHPVCRCERTDHSLRARQSSGRVPRDSTRGDRKCEMRPNKKGSERVSRSAQCQLECQRWLIPVADLR